MTKTGDVKREKAKLVRMIGLRMKHARELVNMTQEYAAEKLGYANSSKLSKIENASDTDNVPNYIIERAATLYDVSVDYLYMDELTTGTLKPLATALQCSMWPTCWKSWPSETWF